MVHRGVQPIDSHQSASQSTIELRGSSHTGVAAQTTGGQYCSRRIGWTARWPRSRGGTTTPVLPRCRSGDESARTWPRNPSQSPITTQRYQEIRDRIYLQQLPIVAHNQPVKLGGPGVTLIQCCNPPEIPIRAPTDKTDGTVSDRVLAGRLSHRCRYRSEAASNRIASVATPDTSDAVAVAPPTTPSIASSPATAVVVVADSSSSAVSSMPLARDGCMTEAVSRQAHDTMSAVACRKTRTERKSTVPLGCV